MFERIKSRVLSLKQVTGVEVTFTAENSYIINGVLLEIKNGKITIANTWYNIKSIEDLRNKIPKLIPVSLVINGKGLIHKSIASDRDVLQMDILPGINPNDFLFEKYSYENLSEVAIIRKNLVEKIIEELNKINIYTISLSLAFYDIRHIAQVINHTGDINTTQYKLIFNNKGITSYQITAGNSEEIITNEEVNAGSEYIKGNFIVAYGAAIKILIPGQKNYPSIKLESIVKNQDKVNQAGLLKFYGMSMLVGFLVLLLINFFVYSNYFSKNNELVSNYQFSQLQNSKSDSLRIKLLGRKKFLSNAGWLNDSKMISFYADRIAATVPDSVTLISLNINPAVSKFVSNSKQWVFQQDTIIISGLCNDPSLLDTWQAKMQEIRNVKQAKISSYFMKKEGEDGIFTAEVLLK